MMITGFMLETQRDPKEVYDVLEIFRVDKDQQVLLALELSESPENINMVSRPEWTAKATVLLTKSDLDKLINMLVEAKKRMFKELI